MKSLEGVEPHPLARAGALTPSERGEAATREVPKPMSERAAVNNTLLDGREEERTGDWLLRTWALCPKELQCQMPV